MFEAWTKPELLKRWWAPKSMGVSLLSCEADVRAGGRYRFEIEAEILGQGQFGVQVQTDPGKTYVKSSRSQPEIIRIAPPQPVPV